MLRILERDLSTKVYQERSPLTSDDVQRSIRLNPLPSVKKAIDAKTASLIVIKPLVETQNALDLIEYFEDSKALWMYRHYKDVVVSHLTHFSLKNGITNLRAIVENKPHNWRSENISQDIREIVLKYFSEDMDPYDAAALFWYVRNNFFFELNLDRNPKVIMCKYEDLVSNPVEVVVGIYDSLGHSFQEEKIVTQVYTTSMGTGRSIELSPEIDLLCRDMWNRLNEVYQTKTNGYNQ
jgi:hypothetical protein